MREQHLVVCFESYDHLNGENRLKYYDGLLANSPLLFTKRRFKEGGSQAYAFSRYAKAFGSLISLLHLLSVHAQGDFTDSTEERSENYGSE